MAHLDPVCIAIAKCVLSVPEDGTDKAICPLADFISGIVVLG